MSFNKENYYIYVGKHHGLNRITIGVGTIDYMSHFIGLSKTNIELNKKDCSNFMKQIRKHAQQKGHSHTSILDDYIFNNAKDFIKSIPKLQSKTSSKQLSEIANQLKVFESNNINKNNKWDGIHSTFFNPSIIKSHSETVKVEKTLHGLQELLDEDFDRFLIEDTKKHIKNIENIGKKTTDDQINIENIKTFAPKKFVL
ncbi:MAG: hypothetical protein PVI75_07420 [Gammaproteobacteria bacterium]|jgi:hypothetical protein